MRGADAEQIKGLKFSLGRALTEEQFNEHRKSNKAQVVKKISHPGEASEQLPPPRTKEEASGLACSNEAKH
ncbi:MAG: hypothetical protein EOO40_08055 [Deltaproteobacteria bacterium]|nr:MAG: hypothetical protein EOO40_08055 [Deltaproteobacteria bacterium]